MLYRTFRNTGLMLMVTLALSLSAEVVRAQDAAWEGMINAGRAALQQQNFSEAERHFEAALEAAERFPPGDPRLGKSFNNLAAVYYAQQDYTRAEPLMRRALGVLQESLGPENTEVAQTMKNLAALYYLQGNVSDAEPLLQDSLVILEKVHGPNHAYVATVLSNLAGLYQAQDRYHDAEPLLTRSLEIWENLLGTDHPDVKKSRALLDRVRDAKGQASPAPSGPETAEVQPADQATPADAAAQAEEDAAEASRTQVEAGPAASVVPVPAPNPAEADDGAGVSARLLPSEPVEADRSNAPIAAEAAPAALPTPDGEIQPFGIDKAVDNQGVSFAVYLSTLWSVDEAKRYWQALRQEMPEILDGKRMEIEEVVLAKGQGAFYRVLTSPFPSDPDAQAVCEQIKSRLRTHDCNVVVR